MYLHTRTVYGLQRKLDFFTLVLVYLSLLYFCVSNCFLEIRHNLDQIWSRQTSITIVAECLTSLLMVKHSGISMICQHIASQKARIKPRQIYLDTILDMTRHQAYQTHWANLEIQRKKIGKISQSKMDRKKIKCFNSISSN